MVPIKRTLGGNRLGSGKKMTVEMHNYERSTHDMGYLWRSSIALGTLVPFMSKVGLPGDTFDLNLNAIVKTYPTIGPLFGSFKLQLDVFVCPIRLYQGQLHNNKLGIGMNMSQIKLPMIKATCKTINVLSDEPVDVQQVNPSSLLAYLGIRGIGVDGLDGVNDVTRQFNAIPYLAYWDIYKNYYANKQETNAYAIGVGDIPTGWMWVKTYGKDTTTLIGTNTDNESLGIQIFSSKEEIPNTGAARRMDILIRKKTTEETFDETKLYCRRRLKNEATGEWGEWSQWLGHVNLVTMFQTITTTDNGDGTFTIKLNGLNDPTQLIAFQVQYRESKEIDRELKIVSFELKNIDDMREKILRYQDSSPYIIDKKSSLPYRIPLESGPSNDPGKLSTYYSQVGLALKHTSRTYTTTGCAQTGLMEKQESIK